MASYSKPGYLHDFIKHKKELSCEDQSVLTQTIEIGNRWPTNAYSELCQEQVPQLLLLRVSMRLAKLGQFSRLFQKIGCEPSFM